MASIPTSINNVSSNLPLPSLTLLRMSCLRESEHCVKTDISADHTLLKIFVSSVKDGSHSANSRHFQGLGKAVDISRINGKKMSVHYPSDPAVKAIVDAIQTAFETYGKKRENFGPFMKKKNGADFTVGGHADHVHISVN